MKKTSRALAAVVVLAGCSQSTDPRRAPQLLTALPRDLTADETRVSRAANQFAFTLFQRLNAAQPNENVFVSPLSVSFALGMTMNGANGTTLDEMRSTLGFGASELAEINAGYAGLMSLEEGLDPTTTFRIANSVWYRQDLSVHQSFVDAVRETFDADVRASPFDASTVTQVNAWVSEKTNGKIPTILDGIDPALVMFLINAIYFKGTWREQFDPNKTGDGSFAATTGAQTVKMMRQDDATIRLGAIPGATVGELIYGNGAFVMTVLLPETAGGGNVETLAAALDTTRWSAAIAGLTERTMDVALPKFRLEYERELKEDLMALGMRVPFGETGPADFTRMSPVGDALQIAFVKHKTFVDVNEEGTEAAAVTNVGIEVVSLPPCFCVDRPFLFAIRERFSGTILFMGKIVRIP
jgi:serine protease inhibitor